MGGLDEQPARVRLTLARDVPVTGLALAGLPHAGIEAEVADQMARRREPLDVGPAPGIVISRRTCSLASPCPASDHLAVCQ